jgi:hypothetical protein
MPLTNLSLNRPPLADSSNRKSSLLLCNKSSGPSTTKGTSNWKKCVTTTSSSDCTDKSTTSSNDSRNKRSPNNNDDIGKEKKEKESSTTVKVAVDTAVLITPRELIFDSDREDQVEITFPLLSMNRPNNNTNVTSSYDERQVRLKPEARAYALCDETRIPVDKKDIVDMVHTNLSSSSLSSSSSSPPKKLLKTSAENQATTASSIANFNVVQLQLTSSSSSSSSSSGGGDGSESKDDENIIINNNKKPTIRPDLIAAILGKHYDESENIYRELKDLHDCVESMESLDYTEDGDLDGSDDDEWTDTVSSLFYRAT